MENPTEEVNISKDDVLKFMAVVIATPNTEVSALEDITVVQQEYKVLERLFADSSVEEMRKIIDIFDSMTDLGE